MTEYLRIEWVSNPYERRLVGYERLEGVAAAEALARLYSASRLFVNFFQPSFKLAEKTRVGAPVHKRYHAPETPCARLLSSAAIAEPMKDRLRALLATLDPLRLLDEIRTVQHHLASLASGNLVPVIPHRDADLDQTRGNRDTVQPFLTVRVAVLNDSLEAAFRSWHVGFRPAEAA